jgi:hypothetical protein
MGHVAAAVRPKMAGGPLPLIPCRRARVCRRRSKASVIAAMTSTRGGGCRTLHDLLGLETPADHVAAHCWSSCLPSLLAHAVREDEPLVEQALAIAVIDVATVHR